MTDSEWLSCEEPSLMLEYVAEKVDRDCLVEFVRQCWRRVRPHLPKEYSGMTVAEQFAALAPSQSNHDAAVYAYEGALKAARWAPDMKEEQRWQASLLRHIVGQSPGRESC